MLSWLLFVGEEFVYITPVFQLHQFIYYMYLGYEKYSATETKGTLHESTSCMHLREKE